MGRIVNGFSFAGSSGGAAPYTTTANDYDGTNDYALLSGGLNGGVDTGADLGLVSFWFRLDGGDGVRQDFTDTTFPQGLNIQRTAGNTIKVLARTDSIIRINTSGSTIVTAGAEWNHILVAWDFTDATSTNNWFYLYLNGVQEIADTDVAQGPLNFSGNFILAATMSVINKFNGCLSEIYLNVGETLDPTVEANRLKFRDGDGKPVSLGATGSTPTGNAPKGYYPDGDPSTDESGNSNDFTITGALTACSSSPSD